MTTAEATIATVKHLNESNLEKAHRYIEKLLMKQEDAAPAIEIYTKKDFLNLVDRAEEDIKAGKVYPFEEVEESTRKKYGL